MFLGGLLNWSKRGPVFHDNLLAFSWQLFFWEVVLRNLQDYAADIQASGKIDAI